jgi:Xaa-Pro aminopeptidase
MVWVKGKPPRPNEKSQGFRPGVCWKDFWDKIQDLRKELEKKKSAINCLYVDEPPSASVPRLIPGYADISSAQAMLDEVAWLFNLRGNSMLFDWGCVYGMELLTNLPQHSV